MDVRLVIQKGKKRAGVRHLRSAETIIGRKRDCDLPIASPDVSRRHCLVSIHNGVVSVEDLDSVNGTYVNGQRARGKHVLRPGDRLEIGPVSFVVEYDVEGEAVEQDHQEDSVALAEVVEDDAPSAGGKLGEINPFALGEGEEAEAVLPDSEEDTELLPLADDEEPIPVTEDVDSQEKWDLPPANQLRDLLTQMGDSPPKPEQKQKKDSPPT
jgi:pSer/pThr/pTyr-binding forkhead associated (FHA) protein